MNYYFFILFFLLGIMGFLSGSSHAATPPQPGPQVMAAGGGDFNLPRDHLSPAEEQAMWGEIHHNIETLRSVGILAAPNAALVVTYTFPLRMAPGLPDYAGFRVSAFADHNTASGAVLDYNGGTRTYDSHRGTDYGLYPFWWNKVDGGDVQVIAAAAGTIAYKSDTDSTDHNCNSSSNDPWNYVAIVHADGRLTIYGHMGYHSLTPKSIGETVAQGEYLGTVASSGSASGPHLHFEARGGSHSNAEWIDPYSGPHSQPESLWADQRPYFDSAINSLTTHWGPPSTPDPCQLSITKLQDSFTRPSNIYFYIHYRDYQGVLATDLSIFRPDGTLFNTSQYRLNDGSFHSTWNYGWAMNFATGEPAGTWRFTATYNGQEYATFFNVNAPPTIAVSSPNDGEQWPKLLPHTITWSDNLGGDVNIALYHNGVYSSTLVNNTPSDGQYLWVPASILATGPGYSVRVTSVLNPALYDESNAPFSLLSTALVARDDFVLTPLDTPAIIDALYNDQDPAGGLLTITALGQPIHGVVSLGSSNIVYTPTLGFLGTDVFSYTVSANSEQADATVTVIVAADLFNLFLPLIQR